MKRILILAVLLLRTTSLWADPKPSLPPAISHVTLFAQQNIYGGTGLFTFNQVANSNDTILGHRFTDSAPTGNFIRFQNAALNADLFKVDVLGNVTGTKFVWATTSPGFVLTSSSADAPSASTLACSNGINCPFTPGGAVTFTVSGLAASQIPAFDPASSIMLYDEFCSGSSGSTGFVSQLQWRYSVSGATALQAASTGARCGEVTFSTGAVSGNSGEYYLAGGSGGAIDAYNASVFDLKIRAKIDNAATVSMFLGLTPQGTPGEGQNNLIGIGYDTTQGDTNFMCVTRAASTSTRTSTTVAADTAYHTFHIFSTVAGTIQCQVDAVAAVSQATNVPSVAIGPEMSVFTRTAVLRTLTVDYFRLSVTGLSR